MPTRIASVHMLPSRTGTHFGLRDIHLTAVVEARAKATSTKHSSAIVLR